MPRCSSPRWARRRPLWMLTALTVLAPSMVLMPGAVSPAAAEAPHCTASYDSYWEFPAHDGHPATAVAELTVTNDSGDTIYGWQVDLVMPPGITVTSTWNATARRTAYGHSFTSMGFNSAVASGSSASFGFQATLYVPLGTTPVAPACRVSGYIPRCSVTLTRTSTWDASQPPYYRPGFRTEVTVRNTGTVPTSGWWVDVSYAPGDSVSGTEDATWHPYQGAVFSDLDGSDPVAPGATAVFSYDVTLSGVPGEDSWDAYGASCDAI